MRTITAIGHLTLTIVFLGCGQSNSAPPVPGTNASLSCTKHSECGGIDIPPEGGIRYCDKSEGECAVYPFYNCCSWNENHDGGSPPDSHRCMCWWKGEPGGNDYEPVCQPALPEEFGVCSLNPECDNETNLTCTYPTINPPLSFGAFGVPEFSFGGFFSIGASISLNNDVTNPNDCVVDVKSQCTLNATATILEKGAVVEGTCDFQGKVTKTPKCDECTGVGTCEDPQCLNDHRKVDLTASLVGEEDACGIIFKKLPLTAPYADAICGVIDHLPMTKVNVTGSVGMSWEQRNNIGDKLGCCTQYQKSDKFAGKGEARVEFSTPVSGPTFSGTVDANARFCAEKTWRYLTYCNGQEDNTQYSKTYTSVELDCNISGVELECTNTGTEIVVKSFGIEILRIPNSYEAGDDAACAVRSHADLPFDPDDDCPLPTCGPNDCGTKSNDCGSTFCGVCTVECTTTGASAWCGSETGFDIECTNQDTGETYSCCRTFDLPSYEAEEQCEEEARGHFDGWLNNSEPSGTSNGYGGSY